MADRNPPEFRFNADDQEPDEFYHEEIKDRRIEKLNQRLTLLTILLPCLFAVAIYFGYRDLTGRVSQGRDSGNLEVQKLSEQMEAFSKTFNEKLVTFSKTLSDQDQDFGNSIAGKLNTINKNIDVLNKNLNTLNDSLKQTKSALKKLDRAKADKSSQKAVIADLKAELNPLKKGVLSLAEIRADVKSVSSEIKNLESRMSEEMTKIAANDAKFKKEYALLQESMAKQLDEKISKAALGVELLMFKKNQNIHSQEITRLARKLDSIEKSIEGKQIDSRLNRQPEASFPQKTAPAQSTLTEKTAASESEAPSAAEDIDLQEQDLPPE